ncbi:hypothetical protein NMG60_11029888 [Bertholletia excelsa]
MASAVQCRVMALFLALLSINSLRLAVGVVYKVGDSAGWTTIGNIDYKRWAATKSFEVGDVILFKYNPQFHNVMQVSHAEYRSCNATAPISTHSTGNDSITIKTHGHHFFFCGVPGHCQAGQKVDINVPKTQLTTAPSESPAPSTTNSTTTTATSTVPAPSPGSAAPLYALVGLIGKLGLSVAVFVAFV